LNNIIGLDDGTCETLAFQSVVSSLHSLSLSTISEIEGSGQHGFSPYLMSWYEAFWSSTVPERFFVPSQASLTSLSLGCNEYIPNEDINKHYFPQLVSLKLRRFCWFDIDDFVIKHKAMCPSFSQVQYWSEVWEKFQTEMTVLEDLVVVRTDCVEGRRSQPYVRLDGSWVYFVYEQGREQKEDADALDRLQATVVLRNLERLGSSADDRKSVSG
jgi:hypothetical protein